MQAARKGGETPLADMCKVYRLIDPEIRERFERKGGWMLVRNFNPRFGLPWQVSFRVASKDACRRSDLRELAP